MNKYFLSAITATAIFGGVLSACSDIDGDFESIVPSQYHTVISLKESGVRDLPMSVADGTYSYELSVLKGGVDTDAVTDVMLDVPTQDWVDVNYNEKQGFNYKVLSASMYTVQDYHLKIQPGQSGKTAIIQFDTQKIYAAMQQPANQDVVFILPVTIASSSHQVNPDKSVIILQCSVSPAVISLESPAKQVTIPDSEPTIEAGFVIEKRGDVEAHVRFDVMSQQYLDEHYSIPEGVSYKALPADLYEMESTAVIGAEEQFHTHTVVFDAAKIKNAVDNSVFVLPVIMTSETQSAVVDRSEMLLICTFHDYTFRAFTDKENWSVLYGTIAMPFGPYDKMFDGNDDADGWMGFINDGFPGNQNLGNPYVVLDLGSKVMLGECAVQLGFNGDAYDVMPVGVEFYVSDADEIDPALTSAEWDMLNARGNYGDANTLSPDYLSLHDRLHTFDGSVEWIKVGSISGISPLPAFTGRYSVSLPQSILSMKLSTRYVKIVALPAPYGSTTGDRTKINEVHFNIVTSIDGEPVD